MTRTIVYVACADSHEIAVLAPRSGQWRPRRRCSRCATGGTVMPLALSRDRRRLYASIRSAPLSVLSFAIDPRDGTLAPLGSSPLPASMCWIGLDRSGRWLLSASYGESLVAVSPIGDDGVAGPARQTFGTRRTRTRSRPIRRTASPSPPASAATSSRPSPSTPRPARSSPGPSRPGAPAPAPGRATSPSIRRRRFVYLLNELDATVDALELDARCRPLRPRADDRLDAARRRRQALGGRHPLQPRRPLSLHQRAPLEHARGVRGRSRGRLADARRPERDRDRAARLRDRPVRALAARRRAGVASAARPRDRRCAAARSPIIAEHEIGRNPNWVEIVALD